MKLSSILFVLSMLFIISCGDEGSPVLTITSPENGSTYSPGDLIPITGTITDDLGVGSLRVVSADFDIDQQESFSDTPTSISINFSLTLDPLTEPGEYEITLRAFDADGNSDEEKRSVRVE